MVKVVDRLALGERKQVRAAAEASAKEFGIKVPANGVVDMSEEIVGMYELLDALEAVIRAADPAKRKALAETVDAYAEDCPQDFFWSTGAQSPTLLSNLMMVVDWACRPESESKPRPAIRLVDRKPEGSE